MARTNALCLLAASMLLVACGGGGGGGSSPATPAAPTGVVALPANGQAELSWNTAAGATTYSVYTSPSSPVTKAGAKRNSPGTTLTLNSVSNGVPIYVAVAGANESGESALSSEACVVPTAASTGGLTLRDPLCSGTHDGSKWRTPAFSRRIVNGALQMAVQASNMRPVTGRSYFTLTSVNAAGQRVSTLRANINIPSTGTVRTGAAEPFASLSLAYQPPANRLAIDSGGAKGLLRLDIGFLDNGSGLRAARRALHCDNGACDVFSSTGLSFTDPAVFGSAGDAAASYDTTYTVTVQLNEGTGVWNWTIAGGNFGAGITGSVDPTGYLSSDADWIAVGANPLVAGFFDGALRLRVMDTSTAGGSSAAMLGIFDDVQVGINTGAAAVWDDFGGAGGNSGPTVLNSAKWNDGAYSMDLSAGSLRIDGRIASSAGSALNEFQGHVLSDPTTFNTLQADVTVSSCANPAVNGTNRISLEANVYNDGTPGTTAPNTNQPGSNVGDVRAYLYLDCIAQLARFQLIRWDANLPLTGTLLSNSVNSVVPMAAGTFFNTTHTLRMKWDPASRRLTFQVDGQAPVVVDPTTTNAHMNVAAPFVKAPNAPLAQIGSFFGIPAISTTATMTYSVNNVFTAP